MQQDPAILERRLSERRRQMSLYGRRSTILTGAQGVGNTQLSPPTLLGAR